MPEDDRIVAMLEIAATANKNSRHRFLRKVAAALTRGYHRLIVDLHPRGNFDPDGIYAALWD